LAIDHLVWATPDPEPDCEALADGLGVAATDGGRHQALTTANRLLDLGGEQRYLEFIYRDPDARPTTTLADRIAALERGGLYHWAVRCDDLEALHDCAIQAGLSSTGPLPSSRTEPNGKTLRWRLLFVGCHTFGGLVPFFIDWENTPHPTEALPAGASLAEFRLATPEPDRLQSILDVLSVRAPLEQAEAPGIRATLEYEGRRIELPVAQPFGKGLSPLR